MRQKLETLLKMDREHLVQHWQELFGHTPPFKCGDELLRQALGWHMQAKQWGGMTRKDRQLLLAPERKFAHSISPGTNLIRVWQDKTHQIRVLEDGFHYNGKTWKSLSAIARAITGTPWSGPAFFGIRT